MIKKKGHACLPIDIAIPKESSVSTKETGN